MLSGHQLSPTGLGASHPFSLSLRDDTNSVNVGPWEAPFSSLGLSVPICKWLNLVLHSPLPPSAIPITLI